MSIASEIVRLRNAKQEIRNALANHGVVLDENSRLDTFADAVESAPYAITGTFTPEEDTQIFSIEGLPFVPETVYVSLTEEVSVKGLLLVAGKTKGCHGVASGYKSDDGITISTRLSIDSPLMEFSESGVLFNFGLSSGNISKAWFKAGYTYSYYIVGNYNPNVVPGGVD